MSLGTRKPIGQDPGEPADINDLIADVVADPDAWKNAPNDRLGGKRPVDFIGTNQEERVRELLRAAKYGIFS